MRHKETSEKYDLPARMLSGWLAFPSKKSSTYFTYVCGFFSVQHFASHHFSEVPKILFFFLFFSLTFFSSLPCLAADPSETPQRFGQSLEDLGAELPDNLPRAGIEDEMDAVTAVDSVLFRFVVTPIFFLAGGIAVIVILYSAARIIVARGEEEGLTAAKNALLWAFVGLLLIIFAYTLVRNLTQILVEVI